ncbi:MAG TPA: hypothetical protein VMD09_17105 [Solirubrobacteraceae bacterium]|nr:hypothetical protein [Solirubrobacteraceae bacterium]
MSAFASSRNDPVARRAGERPAAFSRLGLALLVLLSVVEFVLLALWQRNGYWDFSDGAYAQSAREFVHGLVPYRDFAAAQPPPVYLVGALLLSLHDGLASLRAGMALFDLITAALVGAAVWRLSGLRWLAVASAAAAPLLPVSLHEHALLMPETLAAPLLLGGAILGARRESAFAAGLLLALAAWCKLAFVIPALAIALVAISRRRTLLSLVVAGAGLAALSLGLFGAGVWREAVHAQLQVGSASLHHVGGLLAQAIWSELVLLIGAAAALWLGFSGRAPVADRALMRTLVAAAGAALILVLTVFKRGSYINVLVIAEPPLLALAACGAAWVFPRGMAWRLAVLGLTTLLGLESLSLLISPGDPWAAKRPGAQSGLAWSAGPASVDRAVSAARRCPAGVAYSGDPYYAFLAGRRMPGQQPDLFILANAPVDGAFAARAARDRPRCP